MCDTINFCSDPISSKTKGNFVNTDTKKSNVLKEGNFKNFSHPMTPNLKLAVLFFIYKAFSVVIQMRIDDRKN